MHRSTKATSPQLATGSVALLIGTRKGAFVLRGDRTLAVRGEPTRRFRQRKAECEDDERADADHDPHPAPSDRVPKREGEQRGDRPHAGAADEMHQRQNPAADALGRVFAGIGESERLFAAEAEAGDEARRRQPDHGRSEGAENGENPEQQEVELVDRLAAPAIAEFALTDAAEEHAKDRGAADDRSFRSGREFGCDHVRDQRAQHDQIDDVEEISGCDQPNDLDVKRRYFRLIQCVADESLNCLSHGVLPLSRL